MENYYLICSVHRIPRISEVFFSIVFTRACSHYTPSINKKKILFSTVNSYKCSMQQQQLRHSEDEWQKSTQRTFIAGTECLFRCVLFFSAFYVDDKRWSLGFITVLFSVGIPEHYTARCWQLCTVPCVVCLRLAKTTKSLVELER